MLTLAMPFLVEHTAQHPNSCPVLQALALYGLGRIDSGGTLALLFKKEPVKTEDFLYFIGNFSPFRHNQSKDTTNVR